jgi:hypothetical protein
MGRRAAGCGRHGAGGRLKMSAYHFDIVSDGAATTEVAEAANDDAAIRQALLLISEILRDRALSAEDAVTVELAVRDDEGRAVWSGCASGGLQDAGSG